MLRATNTKTGQFADLPFTITVLPAENASAQEIFDFIDQITQQRPEGWEKVLKKYIEPKKKDKLDWLTVGKEFLGTVAEGFGRGIAQGF